MAELLTAAQMQAIETAAIESGDVTGLELMERAGRGVVEAIFEAWPELTPAAGAERGASPSRSPRYMNPEEARKAVVLCGPGNNGGDGFVVARLLAERGWVVEVFIYGEPDKLPPDARVNYERWCKMGAVRAYISEGPEAFWLDPGTWTTDTLFIDALFGTGLTRAVEMFDAAAWVTQISEWRLTPGSRTGDYPGVRVVAVDIPSGLSADTGQYLRSGASLARHEDFRADLTVTFHRPKRGHFLADGPSACGKVVVKDIGLRSSSRQTNSRRRSKI